MAPNAQVIAMQVWDNQARMHLPWWLYLWLAVMAGTALGSVFFARRHRPALVLFVGFAISHAIIWGLGILDFFPVLRGMDAWAHLTCWVPGWYLIARDRAGRVADGRYQLWSYALVLFLAISFIFDTRDAVNYVRYGLLP